MDWNSIILTAVGVLFSWETFNNIKYRKENKKIKADEAAKSHINTQKEQIELGELFTQKAADMFKKMEELQEQTYNAILKNGNDNESIIKKMDKIIEEQKHLAEEQSRQSDELKRLADEQARQAEEQAHIVTFVNGEYQDFLAKNGFKKKK